MRTPLALAALALVCACSHKTDTVGAPSFGDSVEAMHDAQTVPGLVSPEPPAGAGAQGALAQERYNSGQIRPLLPAATSSANPTGN